MIPQDFTVPETPEGCLSLIRHIEIDINEIRTQLATADLRRQQGETTDVNWFRRAKDAIIHKQRQIALLHDKLADLRPASRLKDAIVALCEQEFDEDEWLDIVAEAKAKTGYRD